MASTHIILELSSSRNVSAKSFEDSGYEAGLKQEYLVLDKSKMMCVEAMGVERDGFLHLDHTLACGPFQLDVGGTVRMNTSGTSARFAPRFFKVVALLELPPDVKMGRTLVGHDWPQGVLSVAKSRTLLELVADADQFLAASADGSFGRGIRFYLGFKEYVGRGQLLALLFERVKSTGGASSSSGGAGGGVRIVLRDAVSFGTADLESSSVDIARRLVAERGGSLRGVGLGDGACDRVGIPAFQLKLAKDMIMDDEPAPSCFPADGVRIDLYYIQSIMLSNDFTTLRSIGRQTETGLCKGCPSCDW
ncbi:hypothetical protein SELMODRAFT_415253 [Selaginella moellendorffii]|uniref:Uncharacterized protein n=1 Tax=Selaginella moellendorffii TaxID=88036 RepID=D8RVI3_SELML|nr:hypothetical protein SELMODRAFT_415253 [Selaginella moellendorffii]